MSLRTLRLRLHHYREKEKRIRAIITRLTRKIRRKEACRKAAKAS